MILPHSYVQSVALLLLSLVLLGFWPLLFRRSKGWRFELFGLDFAIGAFVTSLIVAFTFGSLGMDGFSFVDDFLNAAKSQWVIGFAAGAAFNLANMLFLGAVSVGGVSVAATIAMGLSVLVGIGLPHLLRHRVSPVFLFASFALILAAIVCAALAHNGEISERVAMLIRQAKAANRKILSLPGTAKGVILAVTAGLLYSLYFPLVGRSRIGEIALGPYSCMFLVALGIFVSAPVLFIFFINLPVEGEPLDPSAYFRGSGQAHGMGLSAGAMWIIGALIPMMLASVEGPAQVTLPIFFPLAFAAPLLTVLLGVLVLRENRTAAGRLRPAALAMLLLLAAGVGLAALAPLFVKSAA